jgi:hypothetical protein
MMRKTGKPSGSRVCHARFCRSRDDDSHWENSIVQDLVPKSEKDFWPFSLSTTRAQKKHHAPAIIWHSSRQCHKLRAAATCLPYEAKVRQTLTQMQPGVLRNLVVAFRAREDEDERGREREAVNNCIRCVHRTEMYNDDLSTNVYFQPKSNDAGGRRAMLSTHRQSVLAVQHVAVYSCCSSPQTANAHIVR